MSEFPGSCWEAAVYKQLRHIGTEETVWESSTFLLFLDECAFFGLLVSNEWLGIEGALMSVHSCWSERLGVEGALMSVWTCWSALSFSIRDWLIQESSGLGKDVRELPSLYSSTDVILMEASSGGCLVVGIAAFPFHSLPKWGLYMATVATDAFDGSVTQLPSFVHMEIGSSEAPSFTFFSCLCGVFPILYLTNSPSVISMKPCSRFALLWANVSVQQFSWQPCLSLWATLGPVSHASS